MDYWKVNDEQQDTHTDGLSYAEASNLAMELNGYFTDKLYIPMPDPDYKEEQSAPVYYNTRGVMDGWEDQFDY